MSNLFYTYTSSNDTELSGSYLIQSTSAIVNNNTYAYSLVFDVNRRTIWAQNKEYGGTTKIAKNYVGEISEIESGIPVQTYNGTLSYFYVNNNGAISIYNSVKIISFDIYDSNNNCITGQTFIPGETVNNLNKFIITLSGSDAENNLLKELKLTSNTTLSIQGQYPSTDGTTYTPSSGTSYSNVVYNNGTCAHSISGGEKLTMTLSVKDRLNNEETKTIVVAECVYAIYFGTAATFNGTAQELSNFESQIFGNIGSQDNMKTINGNQYFWVIIPIALQGQFSSCKMYQGGGEAEWHQDYNGVVKGEYIVYRTPKKNIGGAEYYIKIN